jgi:PIN like domain
MSSEPPSPEYFLERSLGKLTAEGLRAQGWIVHTIYEHFDDDGEDITDEQWIEFGVLRGWVCLTKDKHIRYRASEIGALTDGHIFCLADGNLQVAEMVDRFTLASPAIERGLTLHQLGFWHVYGGGRVKRMWPPRGAQNR